jgi:hypothetical protein
LSIAKWFNIDKLYKAFVKIVEDQGFNEAIKKSKNAKDLGYRLIEYAVPLLVAAAVAKLSAEHAEDAVEA